MLLVNGEAINLNGEREIEKLVKKYKKELDEIGFPVMFKFKDHLYTRTGTGELQFPGTKSFTTRINLSTPERGAEEMIYCKRHWNDNDGNILRYPNKVKLKQSLSIEEGDWELAVFLKYFYPHYGVDYDLFDSRVKAKATFDKEALETKVRTFIFSPSSKKISEAKYKKLAWSFGAKADTFMELQNNLWAIIKDKETRTGKGYQQFIKAADDPTTYTIRPNVQTAIAQKLIKKFPTKNNAWAYLDEAGEYGEAIMKYKDPNNAEAELVSYLEENNNEYNTLLGKLGSDAV